VNGERGEQSWRGVIAEASAVVTATRKTTRRRKVGMGREEEEEEEEEREEGVGVVGFFRMETGLGLANNSGLGFWTNVATTRSTFFLEGFFSTWSPATCTLKESLTILSSTTSSLASATLWSTCSRTAAMALSWSRSRTTPSRSS